MARDHIKANIASSTTYLFVQLVSYYWH